MNDKNDADKTDKKSGKVDTGDPRIFARVPQPIFDRVDALRDEYLDADGNRATMSSVVRSFVIDGECLMEPEYRTGADAIMRAKGLPSRAVTWREIVTAGIAALSRPPAKERR